MIIITLLLSQSYRASLRHLRYGITQCYLPPDMGESAPPLPQPDRLVLDLLTLEGWKAKLTLVLAVYRDGFICLQTVTHPSATTW